ncbi:hypothetical protein Cfla_3269 [Cellulomonas flavigena DSM 20109]|uniref:Uncharacterized protein n=1 Tax=Cellulomonas flavigena (strain ATCC 482 / DSM 20109 / BCRC 11376 / JCM 18109 / NBRC 3775 / NCIMB 8073 / NRS 134) TaxID=446466 RepID=D5UBZ1_CELFN|nr:hypothetical protein [Cellulomonas flavigena]ADG76150.1 hypothetical protein Cfla_3269 [Cellulomonas flavigena DSM 20109]
MREVARGDGVRASARRSPPLVIAELSRETVDMVALVARGDGYSATITSRSEGLTGILTITATSSGVRLRDSLLRT